MLLIFVLTTNLTTSYACAASPENIENQPASILVLDVNGNPCYTFGNKNIDWEAIGLADKKLELSDYNKARLASRSFFERLNPINKALDICRDYKIIDQNTIGGATPNIYEFTLMIVRVFYQYDYEYILRVEGCSPKEACYMLADIHGILLDGSWQDTPENFPMTSNNVEIIGRRLLQDHNIERADISKLVPKNVTFDTICQFIVDLAEIIEPAPPIYKLIYSECPVIPIIIQPVDDIIDTFNDFRGTQWKVINNDRNETGYLSNGKPITQENILELMTLIEQAFPSGLVWTSQTQKSQSPGLSSIVNSGYYNPSSEMKSLYLTQYNVSPKTACGGFASLVSDILFGANANPVHKTDVRNLHSGDILVNTYVNWEDIKAHGDVQHTMILTNVNNQNHMYDYADGNNFLRVNWQNWTENKYPKTAAIKLQDEDPTIEHVWYTRWPE